ncbi:unnamed protein product [Caenorhabditis nigoni]
MSSTQESRTQPKIDLNKVPPIDHHRTAVTFNCLILKMTEILNNFGNRMEDVLERAEHSLDTADQRLRLMEAKLSAVKLEEEHLEHSQKELKVTPPEVIDKNEAVLASTEYVPSHISNPSTSTEKNEPITTECSSSVILIKDDPLYSKYFKMLKMGVPEAGVIQKMESEGIDPSILHRGSEPSPSQAPTGSGYESSGDSVSSFSDSD